MLTCWWSHPGRLCGQEDLSISACSWSLSFQGCYQQAGARSEPDSPLTSQPIPDQTLTMSLCAPLVGVPRAYFSLPQIKLSAAFLTRETTKKACLSPYWGHVFELESGPAAGLACRGYGLLLTTTCMSYPVNSVVHF